MYHPKTVTAIARNATKVPTYSVSLPWDHLQKEAPGGACSQSSQEWERQPEAMPHPGRRTIVAFEVLSPTDFRGFHNRNYGARRRLAQILLFARGGKLAAGAKVPLRPALPLPRLLLPLPDRVHTPRNTSAISL